MKFTVKLNFLINDHRKDNYEFRKKCLIVRLVDLIKGGCRDIEYLEDKFILIYIKEFESKLKAQAWINFCLILAKEEFGPQFEFINADVEFYTAQKQEVHKLIARDEKEVILAALQHSPF